MAPWRLKRSNPAGLLISGMMTVAITTALAACVHLSFLGKKRDGHGAEGQPPGACWCGQHGLYFHLPLLKLSLSVVGCQLWLWLLLAEYGSTSCHRALSPQGSSAFRVGLAHSGALLLVDRVQPWSLGSSRTFSSCVLNKQ